MCANSNERYMKSSKHPKGYTMIDSYLTSLGFTKGDVDANLYHIVVEGKD